MAVTRPPITTGGQRLLHFGTGSSTQGHRQKAEAGYSSRHQDGAQATARPLDDGLHGRMALAPQGFEESDQHHAVENGHASQSHEADSRRN